jgi:hypothetical protein
MDLLALRSSYEELIRFTEEPLPDTTASTFMAALRAGVRSVLGRLRSWVLEPAAFDVVDGSFDHVPDGLPAGRAAFAELCAAVRRIQDHDLHGGQMLNVLYNHMQTALQPHRRLFSM